MVRGPSSLMAFLTAMHLRELVLTPFELPELHFLREQILPGLRDEYESFEAGTYGVLLGRIDPQTPEFAAQILAVTFTRRIFANTNEVSSFEPDS